MKQAVSSGWTVPQPGDTIAGKYRVERECGRGGLAVVLSAIQPELERRVAIKTLLPEWQSHEEAVERFVREGRAAARIRSEHVVRVFDVGVLASGAPFLVLEYLEGQDLEALLEARGPVGTATAIDWVLQAAEALAEAHSRGIVHRDLKPANLFLVRGSDGRACIKVIDFGLSKLSDQSARSSGAQAQDLMGSPLYMAPEQLQPGAPVDARTDVWALGAVLYELVAGRPPFRASSIPALFAAVLGQPVPPLSSICEDVPPEVEEAVLRCLEKEPGMRFADMAELARALAPFGSPQPETSCERIERALASRESCATAADLATARAASCARSSPDDTTEDEMDYTLPSQASARVVVPSLVALTLLAAVAFGGLYESVHGGLPPEIARPLSSSTAVIAHVIQAQIAGLAVGSTPAVTEEDWKEPAAPTDTDAGL